MIRMCMIRMCMISMCMIRMCMIRMCMICMCMIHMCMIRMCTSASTFERYVLYEHILVFDNDGTQPYCRPQISWWCIGQSSFTQKAQSWQRSAKVNTFQCVDAFACVHIYAYFIHTYLHTCAHTRSHTVHTLIHYLLLHHNIHQTLEHVQRVDNSPPVQSTSPVQGL